MIRRAVVWFLLVATLVVAGPVETGGAVVTESRPFWAVGTVADTAAPLDPTPIEAENGAFELAPIHAVSDGAAADAADGSLVVYVTPSTGFYKKNDDGVYRRSTYQETVVLGADVRVYGRRSTTDTGQVRFFATYVWNPPNQPAATNPYGKAPQCGTSIGLRNQAFNVKATIIAAKGRYPCTGVGGYPGAFTIGTFGEAPSAHVAEGVAAYGGVLDVYVTPMTRYFKGGQRSDQATVVRLGNEVRVFGRYQHTNGAWLFIANIVWTPAPDRPDTFNPVSNIDAVATGSGDGSALHYTGSSRGPAMANWRYDADVVWTPTPTGYTVTGTWVLSENSNVLRGTMDGEVVGTSLDLSVDVTSGEGHWFGAVGGGELTGQTVPTTPTLPPSAFSGEMRLSIITQQSVSA